MAEARQEQHRKEKGGPRRLVAVGALVVLTLLALTAFGLWQPDEAEPAALASARPSDSETPAPWHYDATQNRHWHPDHAHWHPGPPPNATNAFGDTIAVTPPAAETASPAGTPEPFEYDAENDRHWHPGHGHWHDGPPPTPE